jgi:hypothetical protein
MEVVDAAFLSTAGNSTSDIANDNSGNVGFYGSTADCNVAWACGTMFGGVAGGAAYSSMLNSRVTFIKSVLSVRFSQQTMSKTLLHSSMAA